MVQPMYSIYSVILFANKRVSRLLNDVRVCVEDCRERVDNVGGEPKFLDFLAVISGEFPLDVIDECGHRLAEVRHLHVRKELGQGGVAVRRAESLLHSAPPFALARNWATISSTLSGRMSGTGLIHERYHPIISPRTAMM